MKIKKLIIVFLLLAVLCLSGCSDGDEVRYSTKTETTGSMQTTYVFDTYNDHLFSKTVYNENTGFTTEYSYFYGDYFDGSYRNLSGVSMVVITKEGEVIGQYSYGVNRDEQ